MFYFHLYFLKMYPFFSTLLFKTNLYLTHETLKPFSRLLHARFYTSTATAIPYSMLRSYQKECIDACLEELNQGCRKQVVSLPVGKFYSATDDLIPFPF
jgi:hypothetical protein